MFWKGFPRAGSRFPQDLLLAQLHTYSPCSGSFAVQLLSTVELNCSSMWRSKPFSQKRAHNLVVMGAQSLVVAICGSGCDKRSCPSLQSVLPSDNCSNATDVLVCVPPVISQLPRHAAAQGHTCVGPAGPWHWMGANLPC